MTRASTTTSASFPDLFRSTVARHADRPAIEADGVVLTYAELDRQANAVAHALLQSGDRTPVVMSVPIAPASIIGMLGALKAGRIFVPIDPREPPERVERFRASLGAHVFLTDTELAHDRNDDPQCRIDPESAAILFFTSGSTGEPRGILKSHEQIVHPSGVIECGPADRCALILTPAFGGSIVVLFGTLLHGGTLCLFDPIGRSATALSRWITDSRVTIFQTSPSALRVMVKELEKQHRVAAGVRQIIVGGEAIRGLDLKSAWEVMPAATVINHYAATEAGAIAFTRLAPRSDIEDGPIAFRDLYPAQTIEIVDDAERVVPAGEAGRLRVTSRRVALGYKTDEAAGGSRFVPAHDGARSVTLGDLVRQRQDGALEIVGRADLRVKINGQAADPEVVERALESLPGISFAIVAAVDNRTGGKKLVAYIGRSSERWPPIGEIRRALAQKLPAFLIPSAFFRVRDLPRNARGKVDRELLRGLPDDLISARPAHVAPRTPGERLVAELVSQTVGLPEIGALDDIFELGVDSLTMVELLTGLSTRFDREVSAADLLEHSTVEDLARLLADRKQKDDRALFPLYRGGSGTPLFCVPGGGGERGNLTMRELSRRIGRPAFAFLPRGFETRARPERTVEGLASRYVDALSRAHQGPYLLCGFSFGGLVAYEMARQLEAAGAAAAMLVLIEAVSLRSRRLTRHVRTAIRELNDEQVVARGRMEWMRRRIGGWLSDRTLSLTAGLVGRSSARRDRAFFRLNVDMASRYVMKSYGGPMVLIRGVQWRQSDPADFTKYAVGPVDVRYVPAEHREILKEPYLSQVGSMLQDVLTQAAGEQQTQVNNA